jgi:hypothetical protein
LGFDVVIATIESNTPPVLMDRRRCTWTIRIRFPECSTGIVTTFADRAVDRVQPMKELR